jgi:hypothetical protein
MFLWPLIPGRRSVQLCGYGVNVPAMSFQLHEWDIHAVCFGTGDARVTKVCYRVSVQPHNQKAVTSAVSARPAGRRRGRLCY